MKITSEQIKKINDKCSNGWQLDVRHAIICSEKQLVLQAQKSETEIVRGTLWWTEVHKDFRTIGKVPQLHLALLSHQTRQRHDDQLRHRKKYHVGRHGKPHEHEGIAGLYQKVHQR